MLTFHHYQIEEELSQRSHSTLYRAVHRYSRQTVAIKVYTDSFLRDEREQADFAHWAERWAQCGADCGLVPLLEWGVHGKKPYLVMPLMNRGTLRDRLEMSPHLGQSVILDVWVRVAYALETLHGIGLCHGWLTPSLIFFDRENRPYLGGLRFNKGDASRLAEGIYLEGGALLEDVAYRDPARLKDGVIREDGDWYAFAVLMYEMLAGRPIFSCRSISDMISYQLKAAPLSLSDQVLGALGRHIVMHGLAKDRQDRPSDILNTYLKLTGLERRPLIINGRKELNRSSRSLTHQGQTSWQDFDPEERMNRFGEYETDILTEPSQIDQELRETGQLRRAFLLFFGVVFLVTIGLVFFIVAGL